MCEELIKKLRNRRVCIQSGGDLETDFPLMREAADAIEELQKDLERSKEWETFWEKEANEALKKFQTTVASIPRWIPVTEEDRGCPPDYNPGFCYGDEDCDACWEGWRKEQGEP